MNNQEILVADTLASDPRVTQAKKLLEDAVQEAQKKIHGIRPPLPGRKQSYEETIRDFSEMRGGNLWFPYVGSGFGNGPFVELADGSIKYDLICGIGPHYFGHNNLKIMGALVDAAISNTVMQGHLQQNYDSMDLISLLIRSSGLAHCFLTTSGAMANENAFKIAFQKNCPASRILAFDKCFVGRTLTLSQVTDKPEYRVGLPKNVFVDYVPYFDINNPEESTKKAVDTLKKYIKRYPKEHALMCFEFIQGEAGFFMGTKEFFTEIMQILKENHIAVFADEVQTFGRTTELFAFQYFGLDQFIDIASIGKVSQVCATLFTDEYKPKPLLLSQTFTGSTASIKASKIIISELLAGGFFGPSGKIAHAHDYFSSKLLDLSKKHPDLVKGPFGYGAMVAFTPYDGEAEKVTRFLHRLFDAGVIGFIAGSNPTRCRFLPPIGVMTTRDIDQVMAIVEQTLKSGA